MKIKLLLFVAMLFSSATQAQFDIVQPGNLVTCSNDDFAVFDMTTQNPIILGTLSPSDYTITYHTSSSAANSDSAAITNATAYNNSANPQPIWARVEENANPSNYEIAEFHLVVNLTPPVYDQTFTTCDFDGNPTDGITTFNLEEVSEQIWSTSGIPPIQVELTFYLTEADAANQTNPLLSPFTSVYPNQVLFVNSMYYESGCSTVSLVTLQANDCTGSCTTPTNVIVTNIGGEQATFGWTSTGNEMEWEILVLYSGGPFPLPTMDGIPVGYNPITLTGLECPESFDVYVRAVCEGNVSDWSMPATFTLDNCEGGGIGDTTNLTGCAVAGTACFDLTVNDAEALNIDPVTFELTYYTSAAAAEAGTSPLTNPEEYCTTVAMGADEIFIRIENLNTGNFEVVWFTVTAQEIVISTMELQSLTACDDDLNGSVAFNLSDAESQISTENPLTYYTSLSDAEAEINPITDVLAFTATTSTPFHTVYIRESSAEGCDIIYTLQLNALTNCNLSTSCAGANSLCNALGVPFNNTIGMELAEEGNDYGCMFSTPNPTWFYLPVSGAGTINLMIEQSSSINMEETDLDIDFIAYGPFTSPAALCGQLTEANIVDCSYSESFVEFPVIPNAQPGEYYVIMASNYSDEPGYIRITELGNSQGEINCTGLRLTAFLDSNGNGTKDTGESNFNLGEFHYEMNDNGVMHNITAPTGIHRIYDINAANSYDLSYTIDPAYTAYYGITTASYADISVVAGAGLQDYFFPITVTQAYTDVSVVIVPLDAPRPGFTQTNLVIYSNLGSQNVPSGTLIFHRDPLLSFISVSEPGVVMTTNGFTYNYTNLAPFETRVITVVFQVPLIPTVNLGDLLTNHAEITPFAGDPTPGNNDSVSSQVVIGSYDPNDKNESHGRQILFSDFSSDDYLYYTIRFENTGTASAININVVDVLDSQLDPESVRMVSSSHDYVLDRVDNQLNWKFENILLPPVSPGSEDGHGYITFKVKPNTGYAVGDIIQNTANIYFDFNPAIVTNTFETEFVSALAINEVRNTALTVYPNPADSELNIAMRSDGISSVSIIDISGKRILNQVGAGMPTETIDISEIAAGVYFLEVATTNATKVIKKIVVK